MESGCDKRTENEDSDARGAEDSQVRPCVGEPKGSKAAGTATETSLPSARAPWFRDPTFVMADERQPAARLERPAASESASGLRPLFSEPVRNTCGFELVGAQRVDDQADEDWDDATRVESCMFVLEGPANDVPTPLAAFPRPDGPACEFPLPGSAPVRQPAAATEVKRGNDAIAASLVERRREFERALERAACEPTREISVPPRSKRVADSKLLHQIQPDETPAPAHLRRWDELTTIIQLDEQRQDQALAAGEYVCDGARKERHAGRMDSRVPSCPAPDSRCAADSFRRAGSIAHLSPWAVDQRVQLMSRRVSASAGRPGWSGWMQRDMGHFTCSSAL